MKMNLNLAFSLALVLVLAGFAGTAVAGAVDDPWQTGNFDIVLGYDGMPMPEPVLYQGPGINDGWSPQGPDAPGEWMPYTDQYPPPPELIESDIPPMWWNQWWYDDPFDADRRKEIDLDFTVMPIIGIPTGGEPFGGPFGGDGDGDGDGDLVFTALQDSFLEITVNWSSPEWSVNGITETPPLPGMDPFVQRGESVTFSYAYDHLNQNSAWEISGYTYDGLDRRIRTDSISNLPNPIGPPGSEISLANIGYGIDAFNPEWVSVDVRGYNVEVFGSIGHACLPKEEIPEPATVSLLGLGMLGMVVRKLRKRE